MSVDLLTPEKIINVLTQGTQGEFISRVSKKLNCRSGIIHDREC